MRNMDQNPRSNHCFLFLKNITEESDFENFQDLVVAVDACCWLHKAISISLSRFGDDRKADSILGGDFLLPLC